jgi:DNA-directed RNA polymerase subunit H (RpoH/RPB5)
MNNNFLQTPMRILNPYERRMLSEFYYHSKTFIHYIRHDDLISTFLNANIGDVICIYYPTKQVYRLVV